jgi:fatty acid-binding protein DegV
MYSTDPEDAQRLQAELSAELDGIEVSLGRIGAVLGTHVGPRALGLTYIRA